KREQQTDNDPTSAQTALPFRTPHKELAATHRPVPLNQFAVSIHVANFPEAQVANSRLNLREITDDDPNQPVQMDQIFGRFAHVGEVKRFDALGVGVEIVVRQTVTDDLSD